MEFAYFAAGAVAASIVWFFVVRNNKKRIAKTVDEIEEFYRDIIQK